MTTSTTKLIAALAAAAGLLTANAAFAGGNGKGNSGSHMSSSIKLNNISNTSNNHPVSNNITTKKNINLSQTFKKQDFSSSKKDSFCKKDKCWFDSCYSKNCCYPYYFGCSYPAYGCFDYCYSSYCFPTYECNYVSTPIVLSGVETTRMRVALGSVIMLNGQSFGGQAGGVRLRVNGMAMPIQVVEWTPNAVKVQLPQFELTSITPAEIEVVRPDGSLASKTAVELTSSPEQLALGR